LELWAAIDLMRGSVVTLVQGRPDERTVWKSDPVEFAVRWQEEGSDGIHVVDLDAALGTGDNQEMISSMIQAVDIPVQVGGGVRNLERAQEWLDAGASRVVVGTMAYREPDTLQRLLGLSGTDRVVVAADYKGGEIVTKGWMEGQGIQVLAAAKMLEKAGVRNLLSTSVGRDGMASGPDVEMVRTLATETRMEIIASGGIRDAEDLVLLEKAGARAAVVGKALYEGTLKLADVRRSVA
jgi:phosphoribosylformimino-5-aminoimidazole carboxamide ribotide isomerase